MKYNQIWSSPHPHAIYVWVGTWSYFIIFDYICIILLYFIIFNHLWSYFIIFDLYILSYFFIFDWIWLYLIIFYYIISNMIKSLHGLGPEPGPGARCPGLGALGPGPGAHAGLILIIFNKIWSNIIKYDEVW